MNNVLLTNVLLTDIVGRVIDADKLAPIRHHDAKCYPYLSRRLTLLSKHKHVWHIVALSLSCFDAVSLVDAMFQTADTA